MNLELQITNEELAREAGVVGGCGRSGAAIVECADLLSRLFLVSCAVLVMAIVWR